MLSSFPLLSPISAICEASLSMLSSKNFVKVNSSMLGLTSWPTSSDTCAQCLSRIPVGQHSCTCENCALGGTSLIPNTWVSQANYNRYVWCELIYLGLDVLGNRQHFFRVFPLFEGLDSLEKSLCPTRDAVLA
eukprot:5185083-Amphidinium_carterae.1